MKNIIDLNILSFDNRLSQNNTRTPTLVPSSDVRIDSSELDNRFTEILNNDLLKIREHFLDQNYQISSNTYRGSDSPVTMSSNGDIGDTIIITDINNNNKLNILDTLNVYFQCQKCMYEQSNIITIYKHNCVYGITMSISSGICIFISFLETYKWRTVIIIVLNIIICILLVLAKYWKLETTAELYLYISRQFELISNTAENMQSSDYNGYNQNIYSKIRELEKRVIETRDIPNIVLPSFIQNIYPVSSNINMFSFIKKVRDRINILNGEISSINQEIKYISQKNPNNMGPRETNRMQFLLDKKTITKTNLTNAENAYSYMEEIFTRELNRAEYYKNNCMYIYFRTSQPSFVIDHSRCNSFVDEYISFILPKK